MFVENLSSVLYNEKFCFDFNDCCRTSLGNEELKNSRKLLINSCFNVKIEQMQNESEELLKFMPFSIKEIIGDKINIADKIDELYQISAKSKIILMFR